MIHTHMCERAHTRVRLPHTRRRGQDQTSRAWLEEIKTAPWLEMKGLVLLVYRQIHVYKQMLTKKSQRTETSNLDLSK